MIKLVFLFSLFGLILTVEFSDPEWNDWKKYQEENGLNFSPLVDAQKFQTFKLVKEKINKHNENKTKNASFTLRLNRRSHLSEDEFRDRYTFKPIVQKKIFEKLEMLRNKSDDSKTKRILNVGATVNYWNWVERGVVNKVYDQESCGSCYAFTTVRTLSLYRNFSNE